MSARISAAKPQSAAVSLDNNPLLKGTSYISQLAGDLLLKQVPAQEQAYGDAATLPDDSNWARQSFMIPIDRNQAPMLPAEGSYATIGANGSLGVDQNRNRFYTDAALKYTDSSIGGNIVINPPPQFTRYADARVFGLLNQGNSTKDPTQTDYVNVQMVMGQKYGQGRYYSEAIDDNSQIIHLRFGVPAYNSLVQFFTGFYDSGMATAARTGRINGSIVQRIFGGMGTLVGFAILPLFIIPMAFMLVGTAVRFALNIPPTKFYYSKPAMPVYWTAVSNMVNQLAVNSGLVSYIDTRQSQAVSAGAAGAVGAGATGTRTKGVMGQFLPNFIRDDGTIDVKAIACNAKILEDKYHTMVSAIYENADPQSPFSKVFSDAIGKASSQLLANAQRNGLEDYINRYVNGVGSILGSAAADAKTDGKVSDSGNTTGSTVDSNTNNNGGTEFDLRAASQTDPNKFDPQQNQSWFGNVLKFFEANLADGSEWVSFRVDYTGPTSESFSNNTSPSSLAQKINSLSSQSRDLRMNLADGNIIPGMGAIKDAVTSFVSGAAEMIHIDGIAALAGSAFVDIPEHWESSTANLPRASYSMTLISPYGNPISQMLHIWLPLCMLLCGALPLATGAQSHTSPFLCEVHDRGRLMTRLGMIDSISVQRGTSHTGFTNKGQALAVEVSFTIKDLSSILAVPVMPGFDITNPLRGLFDSDNSYTDYLMSLAAMQLPDVVYKYPLLKYQINKKIADIKTMTSASNIGAYLASMPGVNMLSAFMRGVNMP